MQTEKDEKKTEDYFFACCLICRTTLVQAKNGMDGYIRCPQCGTYIHIKIENNIVTIKRK